MSPEQRIDWVEELRDERAENFYYFVSLDPQEVKTFVTAAVYKTLAGHEISDRATSRFMSGSSFARDEETEIVARGLIDQVKRITSESNGYQHEWDEAREQGDKAAEAVKRGVSFLASYDYWMLRPIKASIRLDRMPDFPNHLRLSTSLPEIGDMRGMPDGLLSRRYSAEDVERKNLSDSPVEFFKKVASALSLDPEKLIQDAFNETQKMIFVVAMNDTGHTNFDRVRTAIVYSGDKDHQVYTPQEQFKMLSKKERQLTKEPRQERLFGGMTHQFESGKSKATLSINLHTGGNVWYDPSEHTVRGEIVPSKYDAVYASLYPKLTPESLHDEILEIRRQAQVLVQELGFPELSLLGF